MRAGIREGYYRTRMPHHCQHHVLIFIHQRLLEEKPKMLFEGAYVPSLATMPNYDVSADGQRFLMIKPSQQAQAAETQINVVLNWFEELKQKVPTGKK